MFRITTLICLTMKPKKRTTISGFSVLGLISRQQNDCSSRSDYGQLSTKALFAIRPVTKEKSDKGIRLTHPQARCQLARRWLKNKVIEEMEESHYQNMTLISIYIALYVLFICFFRIHEFLMKLSHHFGTRKTVDLLFWWSMEVNYDSRQML